VSDQLAKALPTGPDKDTFSLDRIDFANQVLISIEWGPNSDCGPVLQINDIQVTANRIGIAAAKVEPPPDTMRRQAISSAFAFIILPRQVLEISMPITVVVTDNYGVSITNTFSLK
jgi:hypothetical protein